MIFSYLKPPISTLQVAEICFTILILSIYGRAIASLPGFKVLPLRQFGNWGPEISTKFDPEKDTYVLVSYITHNLGSTLHYAKTNLIFTEDKLPWWTLKSCPLFLATTFFEQLHSFLSFRHSILALASLLSLLVCLVVISIFRWPLFFGLLIIRTWLYIMICTGWRSVWTPSPTHTHIFCSLFLHASLLSSIHMFT